jgi:hypothetical protein
MNERAAIIRNIVDELIILESRHRNRNESVWEWHITKLGIERESVVYGDLRHSSARLQRNLFAKGKILRFSFFGWVEP